MKINKLQLEKIIRQELNTLLEQSDPDITREIDPKDLERLHGPDRKRAEENEKRAKQIFDKLLSDSDPSEVLQALYKNLPPKQRLAILTAVADDLIPFGEAAQHGSSERRRNTDFDLGVTSTNWREREKKKNLRNKFLSSRPGGFKKMMKKQSTKADREQGKKLARGDKE